MNHNVSIAIAWVTYAWVALLLVFLALRGTFDKWIKDETDIDTFMFCVVIWPLCLSFAGALLCAWMLFDLVVLPVRLAHKFGCRHFGWTPVRYRAPLLSRLLMHAIAVRNHRNTKRY